MISFTFYVYLFLMTFIGSILIVNEVDDHYIINKLTTQGVRFIGWAAICYMMISLPVGILLSKLFFPAIGTRKMLLSYINRNIEPILSEKDSHVRILLYLLSGVSIFSLFYTLYYLQEIPFLSLLKGRSAFEISQQRSTSSFAFGGIEYIRNILGLIMAPLMSYISYSYYKLTRSNSDLKWFILMFVTSSIFLLIDLQKSPFILYLSGFLMLRIMMLDGVSLKRILRYGVFAFLLLVTFYIFLSEGFNADTLFSYNYGIVGRVTLTSVAGFFHALEIFPDKIHNLGISSMSGFISNTFDVEFNVRAGRLIMIELFPESIYHGTVGVINSIFLSEAWANFGLLGLLLSPVYVGFIIGCLYNFILISPKSPLFLGIYAYYSFRPTIIGGFNEYLYNPGNILIVALVLFLLIYSNSLKILSEKYKLKGSS